jgi:polysaccharide export outer membrane protein
MTARRHRSRTIARACAALMLVLVGLPSVAAGQAATPAPDNYVIGIGDVLQVSVWGHTELDRTVTVNVQGDITLTPVGEIKAAGSTTKQLADRIVDRLTTYLRTGTPTVTVTVTDFVSQSVFVSGAVARPGRYGAPAPPPIFDVLNMAGGALNSADLSRVVIFRRGGTGPHQQLVDVDSALRQGTEAMLPALQPGDIIVVPTLVGLAGAGTGQGVGLLGEVGAPGLYPVAPDEDLWSALAQAGGPRATSNLAAIRVLTKEESVPTVVTVNLLETLQRGNKQPYMLKPGDIVYVEAKGSSLWGKFLTLLSTTRDIASIVAVIRVLENNP